MIDGTQFIHEIKIDDVMQSDEVSSSDVNKQDIQEVEENICAKNEDEKIEVEEESLNVSSHREPEVIEVFAEAVFSSSPSPSLTQDELESLGRFVTNLDHLRRNISNIVLDQVCTSKQGDKKYVHTANVRVFVKGGNLWQRSRSYLWKFLA